MSPRSRLQLAPTLLSHRSPLPVSLDRELKRLLCRTKGVVAKMILLSKMQEYILRMTKYGGTRKSIVAPLIQMKHTADSAAFTGKLGTRRSVKLDAHFTGWQFTFPRNPSLWLWLLHVICHACPRENPILSAGSHCPLLTPTPTLLIECQ